MVESASENPVPKNEILAAIIRAVRAESGLNPKTVADRMGMKHRSYYNFEAGTRALNLLELWRFAEVTNSDPVGILMALARKDPEIALRCMENKAASILIASFLGFSDKVGDRLTIFPPSVLIEAFKRAFDSLEEYLVKRDQSTERWLEDNLPRIFKLD